MKQSEKLDFILKYLYQKKFDGNMYHIKTIFLENDMIINDEEALSLGKRLLDDNMINFVNTSEGTLANLNSYGVDYVEEDSYSEMGKAIVNQNTFNISGSTNTNIINESNNIDIVLTQSVNQIDKIVNDIKDELSRSSLKREDFNEILDCLNEIQEANKKGLTPKYAYKSLLTMTSEISSISSFLVALSQSLGIN